MSLGKSVGEFSLVSTSITFRKTSNDMQSISINLEGTVFGGDETRIVLGTMDLDQTRTGKDGIYEWFGSEYPSQGEARSCTGSGFYIHTGSNHWQLRGTISYLEGNSYAMEGDLDLASRSLNGKIFEWNIHYG